MYIEINTARARGAVSELDACSADLKKAAAMLDDVYRSLGTCSGSAVPELRRKIKIRESSIRNRIISVQSLAEVLEKILNQYLRTEKEILFSEGWKVLNRFNPTVLFTKSSK